MLWEITKESNDWILLNCKSAFSLKFGTWLCNILRIVRNDVALFVDSKNKIREVVKFKIYRGNLETESGPEPIYVTKTRSRCCLEGSCNKQWCIMMNRNCCWNNFYECQRWLWNCDWTPWIKGCRATNIWCAIVINAVVTAVTVAVASGLHHIDNKNLAWLQYVLPGITYVTVGFFMYKLIGFGGGSISSTPKVILDKEATEKFYEIAYSNRDTEAGSKPIVPNGYLCLDCDNSVLMPNQRMYIAYFICAFAKQI